jgi:hypothetical protein
MAALSYRTYAQLGRILFKQRPEVARELLAVVQYDPAETDITLIPALFITFCQVQTISPDEYTGRVHKTHKIDMRRLFIAAVIFLYAPQLYESTPGAAIVKYGLSGALTEALQQDASLTSRLIKEVIARYRAFPDYRQEVKTIVEQVQEVSCASA